MGEEARSKLIGVAANADMTTGNHYSSSPSNSSCLLPQSGLEAAKLYLIREDTTARENIPPAKRLWSDPLEVITNGRLRCAECM